MPIPELVLLLDDAETIRALKISGTDLEHLVSTQQLLPIFIAAKRRFLMADVEALVKTYHAVQARKSS